MQIKVGAADELPPGKGKVVHVGGRDIAVYNVEGHYYASLSTARHVGGPSGESPAATTETVCDLGACFDVTIEDSPARLHEGSTVYEVSVQGADLVLLLPRGDSRPAAGRRRRRHH